MKAVKVLQLVSPNFGGIESYVFNHYRHMDQEKFHFDFITQNPALENAEQYRDCQYKVYLLKTTASCNQTLFKRQVREILRNGYDILHLNSCYWTGFLLEELAKEAGIKKVIVHSHASFIDEPDERKREQLLLRHEEVKKAFSPELATDYWACSQLAADWMFGPQIPLDKIRIMKNAIEVDRFQFDQVIREQVRAEMGFDDRNLVLGTVGRLSYQKNHAFLINIFAEFHRRHPCSKLLVIGEGELRKDLERQIRDSHLEQDVLLLGWKTDVGRYLQAMDLFLLPSAFEGFSVAEVEAVAAGLPCIISDQVSKDVVFTENIRHIPLLLSDWISALEEMSQISVDRREGVGAVRAAGYDIQWQAKVLEALYNAE